MGKKQNNIILHACQEFIKVREPVIHALKNHMIDRQKDHI
jgi:hypothetical protein